MKYEKKLEYAERIATELQGQKTTEEVRAELKSDGLYERDIENIMITVRNVIGERYLPKIKEYLLEGKDIHGAQEFGSIDNEILDNLIMRESGNIVVDEKKKITRLIKQGETADSVLQSVDTRFLSIAQAAEQIDRMQKIKQENSGSGRSLNILGGIGLIVLTGIVLLVSGRLFYVLPILGIVMIIKGVTTKRMEYDS